MSINIINKGFNRLCPKCSNNIIKNHKGQQCGECYQQSRSKSFCKSCGIKLLHSYSTYCVKCFSLSRKTGHNLAICKVCSNKLSVYENSNQYNTGICQKCYKGKNTNRWNHELTEAERDGSRTKKPEYYEWRKQVFERDKYTCQKCLDNRGGNLCSHHIENWMGNNDLRFCISNGITLCNNCHIGFHKQYGWKNNDMIQLMEYSDFEFKITA